MPPVTNQDTTIGTIQVCGKGHRYFDIGAGCRHCVHLKSMRRAQIIDELLAILQEP